MKVQLVFNCFNFGTTYYSKPNVGNDVNFVNKLMPNKLIASYNQFFFNYKKFN